MLTYESAREIGDLVRFATAKMPNYVERVTNEAEALTIAAKASDWGLPRVLVFSDKGTTASTSSVLKALSSEFRRRVLIVEVRKHQRTETIAIEHGVNSLPTLICLDQTERTLPPPFQAKTPSPGRLSTFVGKCALSQPIRSKPTGRNSGSAGQSHAGGQEQGTKEEL
mmetsp:Transcript_16479/g.42281  ORF Transcript_16479/g.42281 Transcript_16479/m.42281 type:complete len:168 (+) Transcript_16479:503-1006(+)